MKVKTAVLWWLVNEKEHESLTNKDKKIEALMPFVDALFPGINYFSITGFSQVMHDCVIPVLKKLFPELLTTSAEAINPEATTEVAKVLLSGGYEWQDSAEWRSKFEEFLAIA